VTHGPLRRVECRRELGRRRGALAEKPYDSRTRGVTERPELFGVCDDENVVEVVVGITVDDRGTYGMYRPLPRD